MLMVALFQVKMLQPGWVRNLEMQFLLDWELKCANKWGTNMGFNNDQNKDLQDKQADLLDQTYTLGWMDGYSEWYDDGIDDSQNALNKLENENELLNEIIEKKDHIIKVMASRVGKALQTVKKNK